MTLTFAVSLAGGESLSPVGVARICAANPLDISHRASRQPRRRLAVPQRRRGRRRAGRLRRPRVAETGCSARLGHGGAAARAWTRRPVRSRSRLVPETFRPLPTRRPIQRCCSTVRWPTRMSGSTATMWPLPSLRVQQLWRRPDAVSDVRQRQRPQRLAHSRAGVVALAIRAQACIETCGSTSAGPVASTALGTLVTTPTVDNASALQGANEA